VTPPASFENLAGAASLPLFKADKLAALGVSAACVLDQGDSVVAVSVGKHLANAHSVLSIKFAGQSCHATL